MAQQLRVYTLLEGKLDAWVALFERSVEPLRRRHGFHIQAWSAPADNRFIWLVEREGDEAAFEAADKAYYELPEHLPLHEEAKGYLKSGESYFLKPVTG